jgi:predicted PurR-regulated permease PerM
VTRQSRVIYWGIAALGFALVLWLLGGTLAPFIFGGVLAYLLDPLADRLERLGLGRIPASLIIVGLAILVIVGAIVAAVPLLIGQLGALIEALPGYVATLRAWLAAQAPFLEATQGLVRDALAGAEETVRTQGVAVLSGVLASTARLVDVVIFLGIAPIVTFFLLVDWDTIVTRVDGWLPRDQVPTIRRLAAEADDVLAGFIRGQLTVAMIMGIYYATVLTVVGLPYGFVVGIVAGIGTIVPFVGAALGAALAMGIALFAFWGDWGHIALVAAVYFGGQLTEGNVLTPKLVGHHVKLHPVWLLLGFSVFGSLFGFVGVLVAAPLAAVVGVLARFALERYLASPLYEGAGAPEAVPPPVAAERRP